MGKDIASPTLVWFRQDLRLADNPALHVAATDGGGPVIPVFILETADPWEPGGASRWWLHGSLSALSAALKRKGSRLILRRGEAAVALDRLIGETGARRVVWNRAYEPFATERDTAIKASLKKRGVMAESHKAALLAEPWEIRTRNGDPYRVFTPFWKALRNAVDVGEPLPVPRTLAVPVEWPKSDRLEDWKLRPTRPDWASGLRETWNPGEDWARERLKDFLDDSLTGYGDERNRPDLDGTSGLSPHLHWGEISPRQIWRAVEGRRSDLEGNDAEKFLSEIAWREFAHHLLYAFPDLPEKPLNERFADFPWVEDEDGLEAWKRGRTGYPMVDAGMRQLWHIGWMHNRVRMIVGSFLVKHLLRPWQAGERWFWDTLVDADLANNSTGWQWIAGCGADAAPYFRVFNPILQGEKFDPLGDYVRRWVPELAELPKEWIHKPWKAPPETLDRAGVRLGKSYPHPVVDHEHGRRRALDAYAFIGKGGS
ncbi:deoxyribodipyrimidine photo-lyase [Inquilinus sp. CAU 1745]|uniref:cryptochrome/photolyase family protein n=1 Tax=Inquilinus sp. CAU 1745 TaxID=3140369 RepID=UPI00325B37E9